MINTTREKIFAYIYKRQKIIADRKRKDHTLPIMMVHVHIEFYLETTTIQNFSRKEKSTSGATSYTNGTFKIKLILWGVCMVIEV